MNIYDRDYIRDAIEKKGPNHPKKQKNKIRILLFLGFACLIYLIFF